MAFHACVLLKKETPKLGNILNRRPDFFLRSPSRFLILVEPTHEDSESPTGTFPISSFAPGIELGGLIISKEIVIVIKLPEWAKI